MDNFYPSYPKLVEELMKNCLSWMDRRDKMKNVVMDFIEENLEKVDSIFCLNSTKSQGTFIMNFIINGKYFLYIEYDTVSNSIIEHDVTKVTRYEIDHIKGRRNREEILTSLYISKNGLHKT